VRVAKLIGVFSPRFREPSICEACGEEFVCGATLTGCWCTEIQTTPEQRGKMRERYSRCLCRTCLEGFASKRVDEAECR
jgi:hypothetical protein